MGIGFQSFGGMLTGGGDDAAAAAPGPEAAANEKIEGPVTPVKEDLKKKDAEIDAKEVSYNDLKN